MNYKPMKDLYLAGVRCREQLELQYRGGETAVVVVEQTRSVLTDDIEMRPTSIKVKGSLGSNCSLVEILNPDNPFITGWKFVSRITDKTS
jgi:hypothetical protein